jgi:UDP-N-acetylmuramyl tripeptide synthase
MSSARASIAVALARCASTLSRVAGGGGTSLPGRILLRCEPDALKLLARRLPAGSVVISATNGKTTTAAMAAAILSASGRAVLFNRSGANMSGGIAGTLLEARAANGDRPDLLGLFEVDEMWLAQIVGDLAPAQIVLGNLLRDQLDRYGELEEIAARWALALATPPGNRADCGLCADDPLVADLGGKCARAPTYFGIEDPAVALPEAFHALDARHCRRCGAPYRFERLFLAHLGHYECPGCGARRPTPAISAREIALAGARASRFTLVTPAGSAPVTLRLPGLYNIYNALGAATIAHGQGVSPPEIARALEAFAPAFGRAEAIAMGDKELRIMLIKNPAGATEVVRALAGERAPLSLLAILNDHVADGRDVSWIWDAEIELLAASVRRVICSGTRAPELALRLAYAGIERSRIAVEPDLRSALALALEATPEHATLYALPTYTAMLELRKLLGRGGRRLRGGA